eukprot:778843-Pleurochrysis_carterae.AAC.1
MRARPLAAGVLRRTAPAPPVRAPPPASRPARTYSARMRRRSRVACRLPLPPCHPAPTTQSTAASNPRAASGRTCTPIRRRRRMPRVPPPPWRPGGRRWCRRWPPPWPAPARAVAPLPAPLRARTH